MSCPWANISKPEPVNLDEIMSEEVARDLQTKEEMKLRQMWDFVDKSELDLDDARATNSPSPEILDFPEEILSALSSEDLNSDEAIAQLLQAQFDREYDEEVKKSEQKINGSSKVSVSFENYLRTPKNYLKSDLDELEDEELEDIVDRKDWDRFDSLERDFNVPQCGYKMLNGKMVSKHDVVMSGRKNACKLMSFPPTFQTGDGEDFDLKLSNKVFNSLKMYSKQEEARSKRVHDRKEENATVNFGIDLYTRMVLVKLIQNLILKRVNGVVSIGKEAVILHAEGEPNSELKIQIPENCAIKVFKTTVSEYRNRDQYIKDDIRFKSRIGSKQTNRKFVHLWAEKEMANLMRLKNAGVPCPNVVKLKQHVLVMSFIGSNHNAAPKLKDAILREDEYSNAYEQVVEAMKLMYTKANLIHADLSEYNILWHKKRCFIIDVSQAVEPCHENAFHFLNRDCSNIVNFFASKNVENLPTTDELFESITGYSFQNKLDLQSLQESFKMKPHLVDRPGMESSYNFDSAWERSKQVKQDIPLVEPPKA